MASNSIHRNQFYCIIGRDSLNFLMLLVLRLADVTIKAFRTATLDLLRSGERKRRIRREKIENREFSVQHNSIAKLMLGIVYVRFFESNYFATIEK